MSRLPVRFPQPLPLLRAAAVEAAVLTGHLLLYATGLRDEQHPATLPPEADGEDPAGGDGPAEGALALLPTEGRSHPPVLLLHGLADNRSVYLLLRRTLVRHGWRHVYALNHSVRTRDVYAAAEELGAQVEEICERTGHRQVDIVGHSLGGLIGRTYVQRLGGDARVRVLVTLGTPHAGTRLAPAFSPYPVVRHMHPQSELVQDLARPQPGGCSTLFVSFWSDLDEVMVPRESARLDHSDLRVRNIRIRGVGHLTLPVDPGVSLRIRAELAGEAGDTDTGEETEGKGVTDVPDGTDVTGPDAEGSSSGAA